MASLAGPGENVNGASECGLWTAQGTPAMLRAKPVMSLYV